MVNWGIELELYCVDLISFSCSDCGGWISWVR
jgi:hypothetical protein